MPLNKPWPLLKPGDTIDIVAPASRFAQEHFSKLTEFIASWDLKCSFGENIFGEDLLCANSDAARFEHLKTALLNPNSQAIWSVAGGYGSARLIPYLIKMQPPKQPKLFIGLSDVTVLHTFLNQHWGWATLHGPAARQIVLKLVEMSSFQKLHDVIFGKTATVVFTDLSPLNHAARQERNLASSVIGGNLSLIQTSIGTAWQLRGQAKIILLEDTHERPYRIDRMLVHLQQAGIFEKADAVLFGDFTQAEKPDERPKIIDILKRFAEQVDLPVLKCESIGHGAINNPLPFGKSVALQLGSSPSLTCFL